MVPAKKFGVKVTQYMVGFGPTLWSRITRRHRVRRQGHPARRLHPHDRHGAAAPRRQPLPLAAPDGHRHRGLPQCQPRRGRPGRRAAPVLPAHARQEDDRHARRPDDESGHLPRADLSSCSASRHRRTRPSTTTVASVSKCVVPADLDRGATRPTAATPNAPAYVGGLKPGDRSWPSTARRSPTGTQAVPIIESSAGRPLTMVVDRNGAHTSLLTRHAGGEREVRQRHRHQDQGGGLHRRLADHVHRYYQPVAAAAGPRPGRQPGRARPARARQLPEQDRTACGTPCSTGKPRDPNGRDRRGRHRPARRRHRRRASCSTCRTRSYALVGLLAGVNLLLFFFNLLPLLPLDGGHVAGALVEAAKRGRARLRCARPSRSALGDRRRSAARTDLRRHRADAAGDVRASPRC